jgi:hypothetical protein
MKCAIGGCGGSPTTLACGQGDPAAVAVDATGIYWAGGGVLPGTIGTLVRLPIAGGAPITLATGQNQPSAIALDATNIYWTNFGSGINDGSVMMVAKP